MSNKKQAKQAKQAKQRSKKENITIEVDDAQLEPVLNNVIDCDVYIDKLNKSNIEKFQTLLRVPRCERLSKQYDIGGVISSNDNKDCFIYIDDNNLEPSLCDNIVNRFEEDNKKVKGVHGYLFVDDNIKNTIDLNISDHNEWRDIDEILFTKLASSLSSYFTYLENQNTNLINIVLNNFVYDNGFQIQKYFKAKGHYIWHNDSSHSKLSCRILAFIWYLNDIEEGGETMFLQGKIRPTKGKLVIFPATWTYLHKGHVPLSDNKYIITGWISVPTY